MLNSYSGTENLEIMRFAVNYNSYLLSIVDRHIDKEQRILDFGAGIGTLAIPLFQQNYNVQAVEIDSQMSLELKEKGITTHHQTQGIENNSFDLIYSFNVLEHIQDDSWVVNEWHRLLSPGGKIVLYVPAFQMLYSAMDKKVGHFRRYHRKSLKKLFDESKFEINTLNYVDSCGFIITLFYKSLMNKSGDLNVRTIKFFDKAIFPISLLLDRIFKHLFGKNVFLVATKKRRNHG